MMPILGLEICARRQLLNQLLYLEFHSVENIGVSFSLYNSDFGFSVKTGREKVHLVLCARALALNQFQIFDRSLNQIKIILILLK